MLAKSQLDEINDKYWKSQRRSYKDEKELPVRVIYYGRVSTMHAAQLSAHDNQMEYYSMLGNFHKNWITVGEFSDTATGTNTNRQGFTDMIQMAMRGEADLIVTRDWSRWGRNATENIKYVRMLRELGVEVYAVSDNTWSFDETADFSMGLQSVISESESRRISTKVKAGQMVSRNKNILYGNGSILGYDHVKGRTSEETHYVINPEQAETVKRMFELYSEGYGLSKICSILISEGRLNSSGRSSFCPTYISRCLENRVYTGCLTYNKSSKKDMLEKRKVNTDKSTHVYIKSDKVPQIISDELFDRVTEIRNSKKRKITGKAQCTHLSEEKYMSKMKCSCSKTFKRYKWREVQGKPVYGYSCRNVTDNKGTLVPGIICKQPSIPQWHMDLQWFYIINYVFDRPADTVRKLVQLVDRLGIHSESFEVATKRIETFEKSKDKVLRRKISLQNKWLDELLSNDEYKRLSEGIDAEIRELDSEIAEIRGELAQYDNDSEIKVATIQKIETELLGGDKYAEINYESEEMFKAIVARVQVMPNHCYRWYLNIGTGRGWGFFTEEAYELYDYFTISFDEARRFRKRNNQWLRECQYNPIKVEVFIRTK